MRPLISIVAANINSPEWAELLVQSLRRFTKVEHEIIIIDNGSLERNLEWLRAQPDIVLVEAGENLGHGGAMDMGTIVAKGRYVCVLDIDAHVQRDGWDTDLIALYSADPKTRLIGCIGPSHKPLHPPLFFYERAFILDNGLSFAYQPDVDKRSTDTAQLVYWQILDLGFKVERLEKGAKVYEEKRGDEIVIAGKSSIYHSWYGVRFQENGDHPKLELDGYKLEDHLRNKALLFAQPAVKDILGRA
jgi:glycosyltransferase involved in cell wall biosynthesis